MILKPWDKMNYLGNRGRQKKERIQSLDLQARQCLERSAEDTEQESQWDGQRISKERCPGLLDMWIIVQQIFTHSFPNCGWNMLPCPLMVGYVNFFGQWECKWERWKKRPSVCLCGLTLLLDPNNLQQGQTLGSPFSISPKTNIHKEQL